MILLPVNLDALLLNIIVGIIVVAPVLWVSGRILVGKKKAKFGNAVWIVVLGTVIAGIFGALFYGVLASIIQLLIWVGLVKHFFDCGWILAIVISALSVILFSVVVTVLGALGLSIWSWTETAFPT